MGVDAYIVHSTSDRILTLDDASQLQDIDCILVLGCLVHSDGTQQALGLGGYLDIGIHDTMKDLIVNFIGAVVFSVIGFFYVKEKGKGRFAARFIPRVLWGQEKQMKDE